ncbi:MAG: HAD-IA family hydrolase [Chloroflexota bacterium]
MPLRPDAEPLTPEEMEAFLSRVRAEGRSLTSEEQYALFGPPKSPDKPVGPIEAVSEMDAADLDAKQFSLLTEDFFGEFGSALPPIQFPMIQGIIFDFDYTLAQLTHPRDDLLEEGARNAEAYMLSTGMTLPDNFWQNIIEARRFSEEKSAEEQEEHIADDAMSFLLQFYGYPASKMDPAVLRRAVDTFYAPEMMAWHAEPSALEVMETLHSQGYRLAIVSNYNCDRVFQRMIDYSGFRPYLDICIASASVEYRKPDKQIFELVLERWDALPHEVVIVGDSLLEDIQGALNLGSYSVQMLVPTSSQVHYDNEQVVAQFKPDKAISTFSQLPEIIHNWAY